MEREAETERRRQRQRDAAAVWGERTHSNWPSGYESLKNENAVIILIRYKVF